MFLAVTLLGSWGHNVETLRVLSFELRLGNSTWFNQKRDVSLYFTQFELKVAVKRFRATLNCELCVLSTHGFQPDCLASAMFAREREQVLLSSSRFHTRRCLNSSDSCTRLKIFTRDPKL